VNLYRSVRAPQNSTMPLALAAVYLIWGSTFLVIRFAAEAIPPFFMVGTRFAVAGGLLILLQRLRGQRLPPWTDWLALAPIGGLLFLGGNGLIVLAEARGIPSGTAAVLNATIPLWMVLLGASSSRPTRLEWAGLATGFGSIVLLAGGPDLRGVSPTTLGALLCAPLTWCVGSILARRRGASGSMMAGVQMLTGGLIALLAAFATGEHLSAELTPRTLLALGYLVVLGSLVGFTAYAWLLHHARPTLATSYAYVNPLVAVVLGASLGHELIGWRLMVATPLVVASVGLVITARRAAADSTVGGRSVTLAGSQVLARYRPEVE
jgi:drug/metabolite transporter (DMT)-like permease